jgi:hypothetical protein
MTVTPSPFTTYRSKYRKPQELDQKQPGLYRILSGHWDHRATTSRGPDTRSDRFVWLSEIRQLVAQSPSRGGLDSKPGCYSNLGGRRIC